MSNHATSYMLNDVLRTMDHFGVFSHLGREQTQHLVGKILQAASQIDCNPGEILAELDERLGLCALCGQPVHAFVGLCEHCHAEC